jgi:hypothetical protein
MIVVEHKQWEIGSRSPTGLACLHLGPRGERCGEDAGPAGFCAKHDPEFVEAGWKRAARRGGAALLITSSLWPVIAEMVRLLARMMR